MRHVFCRSVVCNAVLLFVCSGSAHARDIFPAWMTLTNIDVMHNLGVRGSYVDTNGETQRVRIGVLELGISQDHTAYIDRYALANPANASTTDLHRDHATWVAGLALASPTVVNGVTYSGAAPEALLYSASAGTNQNMFKAAVDWMTSNPAVDVLNCSLGTPHTTIPLIGSLPPSQNNTGGAMMSVDWAAYAKYTLVVTAAGNEGNDYYRISNLAAGYNVLAVGATGVTNAAHTVGPNYNRIAAYSSAGPTFNERQAPHLVAPGTLMFTTSGTDRDGNGALDDWESNSPHGFVDGTSFATPLVSGVAAALIQHGKQHEQITDPRVMRAVMMNSADKSVQGSDGRRWDARYQDRINNATATAQPLDRELGTGMLDALQAYRSYSPGRSFVTEGVDGTGEAVAPLSYDLGTVSGTGWDASNDYLSPALRRGSIIVSTLCWERPVSLGVTVNYYYTNELDDLALAISPNGDRTTLLRVSDSTSSNEHLVFKTRATDGAAGERYWIRVAQLVAHSGNTEGYGLAWSMFEKPTITLAFNGDFKGDRFAYLDNGWYGPSDNGLNGMLDGGVTPAPWVTQPTEAWAMHLSAPAGVESRLAQELVAPPDAFQLRFKYGFASGSPDQVLNVHLGGLLVASILPSAQSIGGYDLFDMVWTPQTLPSFFASPHLDLVELSFTGLSETGIYVDDVFYIPSPGTAGVFLTLLMLSRRTRQSKRWGGDSNP